MPRRSHSILSTILGVTLATWSFPAGAQLTLLTTPSAPIPATPGTGMHTRWATLPTVPSDFASLDTALPLLALPSTETLDGVGPFPSATSSLRSRGTSRRTRRCRSLRAPSRAGPASTSSPACSAPGPCGPRASSRSPSGPTMAIGSSFKARRSSTTPCRRRSSATRSSSRSRRRGSTTSRSTTSTAFSKA